MIFVLEGMCNTFDDIRMSYVQLFDEYFNVFSSVKYEINDTACRGLCTTPKQDPLLLWLAWEILAKKHLSLKPILLSLILGLYEGACEFRLVLCMMPDRTN